jgi:uncharacterized surface protein with fasciclin (FAS1) repeats
MKALFILTLLLLGICANSNAQAQFKTSDEAAFKVIKAEEEHKLSAIEQLVEATRRFDNIDNKKEVTILAPNNKAFKRLPIQTIDYLLDPAHEDDLNDLISYHTIEGKFTEKQIRALISKGEGKAFFTTLAGYPIKAYLDAEGTIIFVDQNNRKMRMVEPNYSKGDNIVHVIDGVILPHSAVY